MRIIGRLCLWSVGLTAAGCGSEASPQTDEVAWSAPESAPLAGMNSNGPSNQDRPDQGDPQVQPPGPAMPGVPNGPAPATDPNSIPDQPTGDDCQVEGLSLAGLMYSPGGTVLPHPCEPFHPTLNNPYAVRCIDAWDWYDTGYPGDEYCILPPEPGKGYQVGVHPQGMDWYAQVSTGDMSGYDNIPSGFILAAGGEQERNHISGSPNTESFNYYRQNTRMRPGSHHMITSTQDPGAAAGPRGSWVQGSVFGGGNDSTGSSLPGAQRPDENTPKTLDKPTEDVGLYSVLGPDRDITYNMHHFNATDGDVLKEAWQNLWFEDDATTRIRGIFGMPLTQALQTFAQPGDTVDVHYTWDIEEEIRILTLFGHRHAWTTNFAVWLKRGGTGADEIIYQSFDWFDQPTYRYDSQVQNPEPAPEMLRDGGHTGVLTLTPGDQLHFNCHMAFTPERAEAEGAPLPSAIGPLRFANQAFEGEMCILFGSVAYSSLGTPSAGRGALPSFATVD